MRAILSFKELIDVSSKKKNKNNKITKKSHGLPFRIQLCSFRCLFGLCDSNCGADAIDAALPESGFPSELSAANSSCRYRDNKPH